jgi:spore coat polysaccharide biosynthesis protein SpsF (cytidylyltransferase family)
MLLSGKPVIEQVFRQLSFSKMINQRILATSVDPADDELYNWALKNKIECYRGSLNDVLDRYYQAAKFVKADVVVRITGDCPLIDPDFMDKTIEMFLSNKYDYVSNSLEPTLPDGYDTEVFTIQSLEKAWSEASLKSEREHVTPYIYKNPSIFKIGVFKHTENYSHLRLTLDEKRDYIFLDKLFTELSRDFQIPFHLNDIIKVLNFNKNLLSINSSIERNEGYKNSLIKDNIK